MKVITSLLFTCAMALGSLAQDSTGTVLFAVEPVANATVSYVGNLDQGRPMNDLSWAWSSQNACFVEFQKSKFSGNHVLYTGIIQKYSEMTVTVIPDNPEDNFSVYAYEVGETNFSIVPELPSCIRCEAEFKWDRPRRGKTQDHTRIVGNLVAMNRPYRVFIGVTGADGLATGGYTLQIEMKTR